MSSRSASIAALFSLLIVGLGHWYIGAWRTALAWEVGATILVGVAVALGVPDSFLGSIAFGVALMSALDARRTAVKAGATARWDWMAVPFAFGVIALRIVLLFLSIYVSCLVGEGCL